MTHQTSPIVSLPPPVFFLSDAHLGAEKGEKAFEQRIQLDRLLDKIVDNGRSLVLVGDLFDFWYEWNYVIPKQHFRTLHRLHILANAGIKIHYLAGNHDFRLHGFLEQEIGIATHLNELCVNIGNDKVFIFHGDGILARDHGYRLLKKVLRSHISQKLFGWIHPDIGMLLARGASLTSRSNADKGNPAEDIEYETFARKKISEGYTGVVLGHSHRPCEVPMDFGIYVNLGDWIYHYTYGLHDGQRLMLKQLRVQS
jgi:UDP-2,3-diacylglucosamine hydrolase